MKAQPLQLHPNEMKRISFHAGWGCVKRETMQ
jgi:hypothetical protein